MLMHDERGFAVRTRTEIGCARLSDDPVSATDRGMAVKMEQLQRAYDRQACDACAFLQDDIFGHDQRRTDPAFRMQLASEKSPQQETSHAPRSEEHTSELQTLMRTSTACHCLKK